MTLTERPLDHINSLSTPKTGGASVAWLGQAGFVVQLDGQRIVIDPYLSDSLAEKYLGKPFPHTRMMAAPVAPDELVDVNWVLCTHGHTDHMDRGTLPVLLSANPKAQVLVPRSEKLKAVERGVPEDRMHVIEAGQSLSIDGLTFTATASAHEDIRRDENGDHLFLGYVIEADNLRIWHSGDTIPFEGLADRLAPMKIDLALLPINGRDAERASNGVPGNLTVEEALELTESIGARSLICHHFGMFDFNTANPEVAQAAIDAFKPSADVQLARTGVAIEISTVCSSKKRVLAVCRGNICRSPTVDGLLRKHLDPALFDVDSAAVMDWNIGKSPDPRSAKVAAERGIDISGLIARQVTDKDFADFDLILGMDRMNMEALNRLKPKGSRAGVAHLGALLHASKLNDIPDPYYDGEETFIEVFEMMETAVLRLKALL